MQIKDLLPHLTRPLTQGSTEEELSAITADSRSVIPGALFVAIRGTAMDGNKYIDQALAAGAVAIISDAAAPADFPNDKTWIQVADTRLALAASAAAFYDNPAKKLRLAGITGTNGKTTTSYLLYHILKTTWHRAGLVGTIVTDNGELAERSDHTTPDPVALNHLLSQMQANGCRGAALEVSSHGIDQKRVSHIPFDALVFTNLTQDHLDYHHTMEAYREVKFSWFEENASHPMGKKPCAILNTDDTTGLSFAERLEGKLPIIRYGFNLHTELRALHFHQTARGMELKLQFGTKQFLARIPLIGLFNAYNAMAAIAAAKVLGISPRKSIAALADAPQIPGRLENCGSRGAVTVFVDFAHTPDALEKACETLRELKPKRLITVFGCGGDRDASKRPLMGQAAARHSDICIITSDNPRSEDPDAIIRAIESGMGGAKYSSITDRAEAIRTAILSAAPGDFILIAGKGHEDTQEFADGKVPFQDRVEAIKALEERPTLQDHAKERERRRSERREEP